MAFCSFDDSAALFDATPVENMFISEYMLRAPGDFVKVYLYGLMLCYHNSQRMSLASLARDLDVMEEDVERAYKYWERQGLVRKTGDNPVKYTYYNLKQITLARAEKPSEQLYRQHFTEAVRQTLDQQELYPADYELIFDWIEQLELPEEVVIMLLQIQKEKSKTGRLKLTYVDPIAKEWAQNGVRTVEDVEKIIIIGKERERQLQLLLSRLGQRRLASDEEKKMFNYWLDEWKFTYNDIYEAYEKTISGVPTMKYIDGVLRQRYQIKLKGVTPEQEQREFKFAREILAELGRTGITPSLEDRNRINGWVLEGFAHDMIVMAAKEVHLSHVGGNLDDIENKLQTWKENKLTSVKEITSARAMVKLENEQVRLIFNELGKTNKRVGITDRDYLNKWLNEMKMSMELILLAAQYARESGAVTMKFVNRILSDWHRAGISTVEAARAEHDSHVRGGGAKPAPQAVRTQDTLLRYTPEERRKTYSAAVLDFDEEDS